jgi:hypothetical protein
MQIIGRIPIPALPLAVATSDSSSEEETEAKILASLTSYSDPRGDPVLSIGAQKRMELKNAQIEKLMEQRKYHEQMYRRETALAEYYTSVAENHCTSKSTTETKVVSTSYLPVYAAFDVLVPADDELALAIALSLQETTQAPDKKEDKATRLQLELDIWRHNEQRNVNEKYYMQIICSALSTMTINKARCEKLRQHIDAFVFVRDDLLHDDSQEEVVKEFNRTISDFRAQMQILPEDEYAVDSWDCLLRFLRPHQMLEVKAMLFF